jgi:hypothetical protein
LSRRPHLIALGLAAALAAPLLAACSPTLVQIDAHDLSPADTEACRGLIDDLPDTLAGQLRRAVDPDDALGAAWGEDEPFVLTCGVPEPTDVPDDATCLDFGHDIGWYVPEDQFSDGRRDALATTLTTSPRLSLEVPAGRRRNGFDSAMVELAPIAARHLEVPEPCL